MKSLEILEKAMGCAKNDIEWLQASTSIENVKTNLFDAWHWRMINDAKRNEKFAAAITTALEQNPGARVLDIGCGSGIFSVVAARFAFTDICGFLMLIRDANLNSLPNLQFPIPFNSA